MAIRDAISATHRFGLGPRPGELAAASDSRGWLLEQLAGDAGASQLADLPGSATYLAREYDYYAARRQAKQEGEQADAARVRALYRETSALELGRRHQQAVATEASFVERLVRFWSNHFAISIDKRQAALYAAPMEREAIRPHVLGRFEDLLVAVEQHPGMLRYLDNVRSVGGDSMVAQRARRRAERMDGADAALRKGAQPGPNENLAREVMELHTLGADGGYTQADVGELAIALTGWSVPAPRDFAGAVPSSAFLFRTAAHAQGARTILGKRYAEAGESQARAVLIDLAHHPATARHVCTKLARHFIGDVPPEAAVTRMAGAWTRSGGDLRTVYRALVESPEAWGSDARKFKTPDDYLVSAQRATGGTPQRPRPTLALLAKMGQPPFTPRSPAGFPDVEAEWSGPDALWKRVQVAQALAETVPEARVEPLATAQDLFGGQLDADTLLSLRRAESPRDGLALLFASPAFQWRT